jgi:hypothetical protein
VPPDTTNTISRETKQWALEGWAVAFEPQVALPLYYARRSTIMSNRRAELPFPKPTNSGGNRVLCCLPVLA